MGTRSTTRIYDNHAAVISPAALRKLKPLVTLYRQFDGYPSGMGADLANFIHDMTIVNGFGGDEKEGTHANGAGCFAAQLIKTLKDGIGGLYVYPAKSEDQCYNYHIYVSAREKWANPQIESLILVRVVDSEKKEIFNGTRDEFVAWIASEASKEA